jgi:hypothetical protein
MKKNSLLLLMPPLIVVTAISGLTIYSVTHGSKPAGRNVPRLINSEIFSSHRRFVFPLSDLQVSQLSNKCQLKWPATTNQLLHFWRLWTLVGDTENRSGSISAGAPVTCQELKQVFLDDVQFVDKFPLAQSWFRRGQVGLLVRGRVGYLVPDGESHRDELLSTLAECGVSLDEPLLVGGSSYTVRDILNQSVYDYIDDGSAEFSAVAFAHYLSNDHEYNDRLGTPVTFDKLIDALTTSRHGDGLCQGTHKCYALACILNVDQRFHCLSTAAESKAHAYLKEAAALLQRAQHSDGAWRSDWSSGIACTRPASASECWGDDVLATGHHLEWLAICPYDLLDEAAIQSAILFLGQNLHTASDTDIADMYLQYSHAVRALLLWQLSCRVNSVKQSASRLPNPKTEQSISVGMWPISPIPQLCNVKIITAIGDPL